MIKKYGHFKQREFKGNWYDRLVVNTPDDKIYGKIILYFKQNVWITQTNIVKNIDLFVRNEKMPFIKFLDSK